MEHFVGVFELKDKARITDPCYDKKIGDYVAVIDMIPGKYISYIDTINDNIMGERVSRLSIYNLEYHTYDNDILISSNICVDSGQAGIFQEDYYQEHKANVDTEDDFYGTCCRETTEHFAGIISNIGVVSQSGFGDGSYEAYGYKIDGKYVQVSIVFIPEEEDYEEEYKEEYKERIAND